MVHADPLVDSTDLKINYKGNFFSPYWIINESIYTVIGEKNADLKKVFPHVLHLKHIKMLKQSKELMFLSMQMVLSAVRKDMLNVRWTLLWHFLLYLSKLQIFSPEIAKKKIGYYCFSSILR